MILLHADGAHETVTVRATATTQGDQPVILINGAAYVVCSLPQTALRLVAQTFDADSQNARIAGITQDRKRPDRERANVSTGPNHDDQVKETS